MKSGEVENKVIYKEDRDGKVVSSKLEDYMGVEGIWLLIGEDKETGQEKLLNVGKVGTKTGMGQEILYDIACLHYLQFRNDGDKEYINQFKEKCYFNYKSKQTQEYLYPFIASKYTSFRFEYAHDKPNQEKEKELAAGSMFWRNGGPYGVKKKINLKSNRMRIIADLFPNGNETFSYDELLQMIESKSEYCKGYCKRIITDCLKVGFLIQKDESTYIRDKSIY